MNYIMNHTNLLLKYSIASCIFYIIMSILIIKYIIDLENNNCECSNYWYRDFIKYYTSLLIIILLIYILNQTQILNILKNNNLLIFLLSIIKFITIIYFAILILDFLKLKNSDCRCSNNWKRKMFLYPILIFSIVMIILLFFMIKYSVNFLLD